MFYIVGIILFTNLLLGATITLELWKILKNNYEVGHSWGKKDYKLWIMVIVVSVMFEFGDQYSRLFGREMFFIRIDLVISSIFFLVTMYYLIRICIKLHSLGSNIFESDMRKSKKLIYYILVFCCQWVSFFFNQRKFNDRDILLT